MEDEPEVCPTCGGAGTIPALKNCAKCGKPFRWQEGRSHTGQRHSKGVLYCSALCAKAAAQKAYRTRLQKNS